jgi:hypothetical protein
MHAGFIQRHPRLLSVAALAPIAARSVPLAATRRLPIAPAEELRPQIFEYVLLREKHLVYRDTATDVASAHLDDIPNSVNAVVADRIVSDANLGKANNASSVERKKYQYEQVLDAV